MLGSELPRQAFNSTHHQWMRKEHRLRNSFDPEWLACIELGSVGMRTGEYCKRRWIEPPPQLPQHVLNAANLRWKVVRNE
jgi:hypothetical protein